MQRPEHENLHAIGSIIRSAYMSTRHVKSSPAPFSFLSFFLPPFLLFDRAAGFLPPRPPYCRGPARTDAVKAGAALQRPHPLGASAFTAIEHDGRLDGSGSITLLSVILSVLSVSAHYSDDGCCLFLAGLATKSMTRAIIGSTYIRQLRSGLPRCCLHGRSRRRDGAHLSNGRLASANLRCGPTATHPTCPTHPTGGCRNSAHCRRYRVRVAPCGTRP